MVHTTGSATVTITQRNQSWPVLPSQHDVTVILNNGHTKLEQ